MLSPVARRYAKALLEQVQADGQTATADADLALIAATVQGTPELGTVLGSPIVSRARKERIVADIFDAKLTSPAVKGFITFLFKHERESLLGHIADAYGALRDAEQNLHDAHVRVPAALDASSEAELTKTLEARTGGSVRLHVTVDPSLIGGLVVRIGDTVYDGSVRYRLGQLRDHLRHGSTN